MDVTSVVKESLVGSSSSRLKKALLLFQIGLSSGLLVASFFIYDSLRNAEQMNPGFDTKDVTLVHLNLKPTRWKADQSWRYFQNLKQHLQVQPGVESVGIGGGMPLSGMGWVDMYVDGLTSNEKGDDKFIVGQFRIGPDYFKTMGIPLVKGRYTENTDHFKTERVVDHPGPLPVIVNETLASQFFKGKDPINRIVYKGPSKRALQIVGVVNDFKVDLWNDPKPCIYIPYDHNAPKGRYLVWHIKTATKSGLNDLDIAKLIREFDSSVPISFTSTIERHLNSEFRILRLGGVVSSCLAILGIILCSIGIWSTYRFELLGRRKEIGTRIAIGATDGSLLAMLLKNGMVVMLLGLLGGFVLAYYSLSSSQLLYKTDVNSVLPYLYVAAIVMIVVGASIWSAARKMLRTSPTVLIREEA